MRCSRTPLELEDASELHRQPNHPWSLRTCMETQARTQIPALTNHFLNLTSETMGAPSLLPPAAQACNQVLQEEHTYVPSDIAAGE